jgi:hypothetical protein
VPVSQGKAFTLYTYASLSNYTKGGKTFPELGIATGLGSSYEITMVAGFGETVTNVGASFPGAAVFQYDPTNTVNFFQIYIDTAKDADNSLSDGTPNIAGTGFQNGTLIMSGTVNKSLDTYAVGTADAGPLDQLNGDQYTAAINNLTGSSYTTIDTVGGAGGGSTSITALLSTDYINTDYFPDITNLNLPGFTISFNTLLNTPFTTVDPGTQFWDASTNSYITPNVGGTNGSDGPDFEFTVDANQSMNPVPEPTTMLLFGTGLLGLAGIGRRKRSKK